jgi:hypothetical protein
MYNWYKIAFFDETPEDKHEAKTISMDENKIFRFLK